MRRKRNRLSEAATLTLVGDIRRVRRGHSSRATSRMSRTGSSKNEGRTELYRQDGKPAVAELLETSLFGSAGGNHARPRSRKLTTSSRLSLRLHPRGVSCHSCCVRVRECVRACVCPPPQRPNALGHGRRTALPRCVTLRYGIAADRRGELGAARPPERQPP